MREREVAGVCPDKRTGRRAEKPKWLECRLPRESCSEELWAVLAKVFAVAPKSSCNKPLEQEHQAGVSQDPPQLQRGYGLFTHTHTHTSTHTS